MARHDCNVARIACSERVEAGLVSRAHEVHDLASVRVFVAVGLSQLVLAGGLRGRSDGAFLRAASPALGCVSLGLVLFMSITGLSAWTGTVERGIVVVSSLWVCLVGVHLSRRRRPPGDPTHEGPVVAVDRTPAGPGRVEIVTDDYADVA